MKRLLNIIFIIAALSSAAVSCTDQMQEINEEIALSRCLTPTDLVAKVHDGQYVDFSWTKTRGADGFVLEVFENQAMEGDPARTMSVPADEALPVVMYLDPDKTYYARVKAVDSTGKLKDSHWASFPKKFETVAIKDGLNPELVSRTGTSITIKWTPDPEVDHIRITPALNPNDEFTRFDVPSAAVEAGQVEVTGLKGSTYYTLILHYSSADRGSVTAWTMPDASTAAVAADTAQFKQLVKDGAAIIAVPYADTAYVIGNVEVVKPLTVMGQPNEDGVFPTLIGGFKLQPEATLISLQGLKMDGQSYKYGHVITLDQPINGLRTEVINCEMNGFTKGLYYDNYDSKELCSVLVEGCVFTDFKPKDGDYIDIRGKAEYGSIVIKNSTFSTGERDFIRIDANATATSLLLDHCTINNWSCPGSNNGIFYVRGSITDFVCSNNLFLNEPIAERNCLVRQASYKCPKFSGNYFFNCGGEDDYFLKNAIAMLTEEDAKEFKNGILASDPCQDSGLGQFNLVNAKLIEEQTGDPRWLEEFVKIPEDLTQDVTVPVKTWKLNDSEVFYKSAAEDKVRDGIRFYVKDNPIVFESDGFLFTAGATLEGGAPVDCGLGIKVAGPGSLVLSTGMAGDGSGLTVVNRNGKPVIGVPAGTSNTKVVFDDIASEEMIYVYGTGAVKLTALQWSDDIETGGSNVLENPAPVIDITSVNEGEEKTVTVSWTAVSKAGAYGITINGTSKGKVTDTKYEIATKTLSPGNYVVGVTSLPAEEDLVREASEEVKVSFTVNEVLKPLTVETAWDSLYFKACNAKFGADAVKADFVEQNLGYVNGSAGSGFKFALSEIASSVKVYRGQLAGGGAVSAGVLTKCGMQIMVGGNGTLEIHAAGSGDAARTLVVNGAEKAITAGKVEGVFQDPTIVKVDVTASAGDIINWYSKSGGINIFYVKWTPAPSGNNDPEPVSYSWNFGSTAWQNAFTTFDTGNVGTGKDITADWDITVDGLNFYCKGDKNRYTATALQTGGSGSKTKRVFTFTAPMAGTLTVVSSNTGDSAANPARYVAVYLDDTSIGEKSGGAGAKTPDTNTFDITGAGKVYIYGTGALRFYSIAFQSK